MNSFSITSKSYLIFMKCNFKLIFLYFFLALINTVSLAEPDEKLVFAIDLVRHGDRTPMIEIPKSPHHWKEGLGQLTKQGMQQACQLGLQLKHKYINQYKLLLPHYCFEAIYVRSTDTPRTIATAKSILQALYPNSNITVYSPPRTQDNLLVVKPSKNIFSLIHFYILNKKVWRNELSGFQNELNIWNDATGLKIQDFKLLDSLADNLYIRKINHISFPNGISTAEANKIIALGERLMIIAFKQPQITFPMGHEFILTVKRYFSTAIDKPNHLKYVLFVAHDSSIMAVMNTLNVPLNEVPKYTARLNFSLFKSSTKYFVKITYNDKPIKVPHCNNTNICSWNEFLALLDNNQQ